MSTAQLIIVCATTLLLATVAAAVYLSSRLSPPTLQPPASEADVFADLVAGDKIAVYLGDGQMLRGVVARDPSGGVVALAGASLIAGDGGTAMAGVVHVPAAAVLLVQDTEAATRNPPLHVGQLA